MAESLASPQSGTFEALQAINQRASSGRRPRPADITIIGDENRIPLRVKRSMKRESMVGLRNIFGRSKAGKDDDVAEESASLQELRSGGIRASLAEISNWPHRLHSSRSQLSLLSPPSTASRSTADLLTPPRSRQGSADKEKPLPLAPQKAQAAAMGWEAPPLFKVFTQAVKHATLPACNVSMETLARLSDLSQSNNHGLDQVGDHGIDRKGDTVKRRQRIAGRKNSLDWTRKIYVLVTSGYILQYAVDGNFDRLPEKVLQLTKDSAAYASDLIPGRHWVLQVAASTDADGNPSSDHKSLMTKLSPRGNDRRQVYKTLLIFENPETMDDWLATLRREIESLGGKKKLSETGKPDVHEIVSVLREQPSQRTLVLRDPERFSRVVTEDFSYTQKNALIDPADSGIFNPAAERTSESTHDGDSTTASLVSADGRHLESLRDSHDSGIGNRLSYISSGQRTVVTSTGSSPGCSPTRESFSSFEDPRIAPGVPEVHLRPNAAAISSRRMSMQTAVPGLEPVEDTSAYTHSTVSTSSQECLQQSTPGIQAVPNFSVPHTAIRRFSSLSPICTNVTAKVSQTPEPEKPSKPIRRTPPTALALSRPLSTVVDQPTPVSPLSAVSKKWKSLSPFPRAASGAKDSPINGSSWTSNYSVREPQGRADVPKVPKRHSSVMSTQMADAVQSSISSNRRSVLHSDRLDAPEHIPRAASAMDSYGPTRRLSTTPSTKNQPFKRSDFSVDGSFSQDLQYSFSHRAERSAPRNEESRPAPTVVCSSKRSASSLRTCQQSQSPPFLGVDPDLKARMSRRSLPQLAEGPPPAPPPNCALPPIPKKASRTLRSIKA
ncbi:Uu.00g009970.m01.CDS01 [Anthostomella pinea]|uniref:Uu.00g009970.m01.CDS01 n=1 Tax=Anthostomella pinea TaxID=933095 RepID=A0AAI8VXH3_9PEZI|nr:Uu.00g009970.m01.CDS01 [Anthostomella pinea]